MPFINMHDVNMNSMCLSFNIIPYRRALDMVCLWICYSYHRALDMICWIYYAYRRALDMVCLWISSYFYCTLGIKIVIDLD